MRREGLVGIACILVAVGIGVAWCAACAPAASQAAVAQDALEQRQCIEEAEAGVGKAALKAEIDECRARVKANRDAGK